MTQEQFIYWLQGYVEINGQQPNAEQWEMIKQHLRTVFTKVTTTGYAPNDPNRIGMTKPWNPMDNAAIC